MSDRRPHRTVLTPERWQRMQELFERALPLDADARSQLLISECGDDIALREQVLSLLLASSDDGGDLEQRYETAIAATLRSADVAPGTPIGRYRVQRPLGRGGMGTVYLAERADDQYVQTVAIKLVTRGVLHGAAVGRFRGERQILARLNHPNIARLLDGGHTEDGTPYLVMEYVEGLRIDHYCTEHRLPTAERLKLVQQVCAAVHYAHQNLIVHRDLKPSNILVTREGTPKLLDFGIAKLLDPEAIDPALTHLRERALTPEHASPEQLSGEPIGTASDIYNLGTLTYELLTGLHPYGNARRPVHELERLICNEDPPSPSAQVRTAAEPRGSALTRALSRELAGDLDNIVLKSLHREPTRRYASAAALAQDIQNYLDGRPVQARPDTFTYRTGKFLRRNAWQTASAVVVAVAIAGLTTFYTSRLAAERDRAELEAAKAKQVASFLGGIFQEGDAWGARGKPITAIEVLERGASGIESQLKNQPVILSELLLQIGASYKGLAEYSRAGRMLERSLELKDAAGLHETAEYARVLYELANLRRFEGKFAEAEQCFQRALALQRRLFPGPSADTAATLTHLGTLYSEMKRQDQALRLQREALPMTVAVFGERHEATSDRMNNLALALQGTGQYTQAQKTFTRAIAIQADVMPPLHPDALGTRSNLGVLLNAMGQYLASERQLREVLPARRSVLGRNHPRMGFMLTAFGSVLTSLGKFDEAQGVLNEALQILTEKLGGEHFRTGNALRNLGQLAFERGDFERAGDLFRRAERIEARAFGETSEGVYRMHTQVAAVLLRQGRAAEAEPLLEGSYAKLYGDGHTPRGEYDRTLQLLASLRVEQGRLDEAASLYERSLKNDASLGVGNRPETADALLGLAQIALLRQKPADAVASTERALANLRRELPESHWRVGAARLALERARSASLHTMTQPGLREPQLAVERRR